MMNKKKERGQRVKDCVEQEVAKFNRKVLVTLRKSFFSYKLQLYSEGETFVSLYLSDVTLRRC